MKPFSVEDLKLHRKITGLTGNARAPMVGAEIRSVREDSDDYSSHLWLFRPGDRQGRQFTEGQWKDSSPQISPDGAQIAFLSDRVEGSIQVHLLRTDGGEARALGHVEDGVTAVQWFPDGKSLLLSVPVSADPNQRGARPLGSVKKADASAPEVCWKLPYKSDGVGYLLGREVHLFVMDAGTGTTRQLTDGAFDVLTSKPSPDSKRVAYVRTRGGRFAHCTDLWVCDAGGNNHQRLTKELATVMQPAWSPDGRSIAFAGARKEGDGESRLWLLDVASGRLECLDAEMEVTAPEDIVWRSNSELLLVRAREGRHEIVSFDLAMREARALVAGDRQFGGFTLCSTGLAYAVDTATMPSELFFSGPHGEKESQASSLNPWWSERPALTLESRNFEVPDGRGGTESIQGWLLSAADHDEPRPLLVDVHGGPASYVLLDYDTNVFWHELCSRGWAILMLNAVGSSSFGTEFCSRLSGHWGELDLPQYREAIRQLQHEGVCDDRVCISGKSYGGYFASWAIGHTDLFKAAVVMAPVGNIETHYGTSDGGYYADPLYIRSRTRFDRARARDLSPLQFIEKATTPTLFLQGKDDERCPKCQSEELFVSLYNAGDTPAELVLYPNEGHSFLGEGKPACRVDAARRIVDWVTRVIEDGAADVEPALAVAEAG
jgi:dipeptidyl aminopeptidase/acylaminoacyl peptidase